jgi:hypothetical protein
MAAAEKIEPTTATERHKWAAFQQLFAGIAAGVVTTVSTHPLDLIKTRMQGIFVILKWANLQWIEGALPKRAWCCAS